jgi:hypothetical protein
MEEVFYSSLSKWLRRNKKSNQIQLQKNLEQKNLRIRLFPIKKERLIRREL